MQDAPEVTTIGAADLRGRAPERRLAGRNRTKADLLIYRIGGRLVAVKDYGACAWPIRQTLGRLLTRREDRAYRAAAGVAGLPRCHGRIGPFRLATDWIEARTLSEFSDNSVDDERFARLREVLLALHARGVAVADLNYRDVLLAGDDVFIVDLAMARLRVGHPRWLQRRLFEHFRRTDLWALARLRSRFSRARPARETAEAGRSVVAWHRRARRAKWYWDRLRGAPRLPPVDW